MKSAETKVSLTEQYHWAAYLLNSWFPRPENQPFEELKNSHWSPPPTPPSYKRVPPFTLQEFQGLGEAQMIGNVPL